MSNGTTTSPLRIPAQAVPGLFLSSPHSRGRPDVSFLCDNVRSAAGSRTQVTSGRSSGVQLPSPLRPGSPYLREVVQRPDSQPKPPVSAGRHASEGIR